MKTKVKAVAVLIAAVGFFGQWYIGSDTTQISTEHDNSWFMDINCDSTASEQQESQVWDQIFQKFKISIVKSGENTFSKIFRCQRN